MRVFGVESRNGLGASCLRLNCRKLSLLEASPEGRWTPWLVLPPNQTLEWCSKLIIFHFPWGWNGTWPFVPNSLQVIHGFQLPQWQYLRVIVEQKEDLGSRPIVPGEEYSEDDIFLSAVPFLWFRLIMNFKSSELHQPISKSSGATNPSPIFPNRSKQPSMGWRSWKNPSDPLLVIWDIVPPKLTLTQLFEILNPLMKLKFWARRQRSKLSRWGSSRLAPEATTVPNSFSRYLGTSNYLIPLGHRQKWPHLIYEGSFHSKP